APCRGSRYAPRPYPCRGRPPRARRAPRARSHVDAPRGGRRPPPASQHFHPCDSPFVEREPERQRATVGLNHRDRVPVVPDLDPLEVHRRQLALDDEPRRDDREKRANSVSVIHETRSSSADACATTLSTLNPNCSSTVFPGAEAPKCSIETEPPWSPTHLLHPSATPGSTDKRAFTSGGSTWSRYADGC